MAILPSANQDCLVRAAGFPASANQDCLVRAAGSQLHDVIFGILRPFVKIIDEKKPFR